MKTEKSTSELQRELIIQFANCKTNQEVNNVVNDNLDFLNEFPKLFIFARKARKRIAIIRRETKRSWKIYELN